MSVTQIHDLPPRTAELRTRELAELTGSGIAIGNPPGREVVDTGMDQDHSALRLRFERTWSAD